MSSCTVYTDVDVSQWIGANRCRLTFADVCRKLGIDTEDPIVGVLLGIDHLAERVIDEPHLDMMGFGGDTYAAKRKKFKRLLERNPDIEFSTIRDGCDTRRIYYVLRGWDFESLFMQAEGRNADSFRHSSKLLRHAFSKYLEYRDLYDSTQKMTNENKYK